MCVPNDQQDQLLKAVLKRAKVDRPFRQGLLTNPHTAIEQAFGITVPAEYRVRFVERDADVDALIVLPGFDAHAAELQNDELSDDELEHVAGGKHAHRWGD